MNRVLKSVTAIAIASGLAGSAAAADLTVRVEGVETAAGTFHIAVFDGDGWTASDALAGGVIAAEEGAELTLSGLAPGTYGVKLYQDVDGNGQLNLGLLGKPSEPYGFSNNASARMGPPKFARAGFDLPEDGTVQTITLQ